MKGFVPTPDDTVDFMVDRLFWGRSPRLDSRVLDPGCGTGAFIEEVIRWCSKMKRKQGTNLKSRNMIGQTNEVLCKALVHNICVLIQEMFESGVTVDFQLLAEDELMCKSLP